MNDHDERDPFPEASVPEGAPDGQDLAPAADGGPAAPNDVHAAAEAPASDAVPPSEAPTMPLIPLERLRYQLGPAPEPRLIAEASATETAPVPVPSPEPAATSTPPAAVPPAPAPAATPLAAAPAPPATAPAARDLIDRRAPLYRDCKGYRLRLDPPDLARLRELPGSRGKSDDEIGEAFFDGQADRLAASIADDVPTPSEIRVVVDPYSRQAFLALENRIRGILSF
ncbi:MAG TPA: hypothetical protein VH854_05145 [Thermoanaerobaculia bacterium]|nr:hypothetical protein [Thermoanaerobaculia bacterium]